MGHIVLRNRLIVEWEHVVFHLLPGDRRANSRTHVRGRAVEIRVKDLGVLVDEGCGRGGGAGEIGHWDRRVAQLRGGGVEMATFDGVWDLVEPCGIWWQGGFHAGPGVGVGCWGRVDLDDGFHGDIGRARLRSLLDSGRVGIGGWIARGNSDSAFTVEQIVSLGKCELRGLSYLLLLQVASKVVGPVEDPLAVLEGTRIGFLGVVAYLVPPAVLSPSEDLLRD